MNTFGIELDTVRAYLGLENGSPSNVQLDLLLQIWLESAITTVQDISGRSLERAIYRDTFGYRPQVAYLNELPVEALISVSQSETVFTQSTDFLFFPKSGRMQFLNRAFWRGGPYWGCGYESLVVDYIGGYTTLPASLVMAVLVGIQAAYRSHLNMLTAGGLVKSITVVDVGTTTFDNRLNTSSAVMQQAIDEHLSGFFDGPTAFVLGAPLLHETERIGDAPESPL